MKTATEMVLTYVIAFEMLCDSTRETYETAIETSTQSEGVART